MAENHASKKQPPLVYHLKDVEYFDYFKAQIEISGAVLDKFGKEFDEINVNDFNAIIHYNCLQVITYLIQKRRGHIFEIKRLAELKKQNATQIATLIREKADFVKSLNAENKENGLKQQRIKELESFWTIEKTNLDSQITQLKAEAETLKKDVKDKDGRLERYQTERNTAERELENMKETLKVVNAECKKMKENNVELKADLNAANDKIRDLEHQLEQMNSFQNEIEQLKKDFDAKDSELKNLQHQFESAKKELTQKKEEVEAEAETLNKKNAELDSNLNDAKKQINELQTQINQWKKDFEVQDDELKIVQTQLELSEEELKEYKEKCKNLEESAAIERSQMTQIEVEQLRQALECSQEQCEKYQKELDEIGKEKERKSALKALFESVKDVRVKTSCKRAQKIKTAKTEGNAEILKSMEEEIQMSKSMICEKQNIINRISADYSNLFHEYTRLNRVIGELNSELAEAKKRRERNDKRNERKRLSKEQLQSGNVENNERSASKRARNDMQQHPALSFNFFSPTEQQLIRGPISSSSPTLPSPPNLSPQLPRPAQPSNIGVNVQPNAFPFSIPQLNPASGPSNMHLPPQFYNFPPYLQQQILLYQEMLNGRSNVSNGAPPMNPSMHPINNGNNSHQNQQQLPSPNGIPEMMPPSMPQQQHHHPMCPEQLNAFKWQQLEQHFRRQQQARAMHQPPQQQPPPLTPHIHHPPTNHQQQ